MHTEIRKRNLKDVIDSYHKKRTYTHENIINNLYYQEVALREVSCYIYQLRTGASYQASIVICGRRCWDRIILSLELLPLSGFSRLC